jgi:maltose O-acetyltransferase
MTEREKALAGMLYAYDSELHKLHMRAEKLFEKYNKIPARKPKKREKLIKKLFGKTGNKIKVETPFYCDYGINIEVGENFFANYGCIILDVNKVKIGKNCMMAPNVGIYSATHPVRAEERYNGVELGLPVTIGDNCWLGAGSIICPGVTIGNNVVVGAGAVVTKDFGDNVVIAGNPAKVIKEL